METEKGVALVVYKKPGRFPRYLVLNRKKNWEGWELPKGHLEEDSYRKTVEIELREETGIEEVEEIEETDRTLEWTYEDDGQKYRKKYRVYIVRVDEDSYVDVSGNPCDEHEKGHFFNFEDAKSLLTYENYSEALTRAHHTITD
ncbi:MAG: NUDIX domain-containing protein [Candidatus Nanohaloarchaea archaeon]